MNEIIVRSAVDNDLETLYRFEQGIITTERPFDPTLKEGHINYYDLAAMIPAPHIELVVAEAGGRVVGSGYARIEDSKVYLKHARHAYLGFMFVEPDYRGKGVNSKIIEHLKQWAVLQNITEMRLEVYDDNLPAVKAYEKFGFTKLLTQMRIGIDCDL
jgi:GNAT superfamily N-acetyltransferase